MHAVAEPPAYVVHAQYLWAQQKKAAEVDVSYAKQLARASL